GAALFGYTSLYGSVPGGQAELVRVPHADFGPLKLEADHDDERYLYLSDILPTAWQGVQYADVPEGGSLAVIGLGPVGQMAVRAAAGRSSASTGWTSGPRSPASTARRRWTDAPSETSPTRSRT